MKRSTIDVLQLKARRSGFADSFPDSIMFSTPSASKGKVHYFSLRIGRGIAKRGGFRPGDKVKVEFDDETMEGWISPDRNGRVLITGDPKVPDCPPVIYKMTWAEGMPSIGRRTALEDVVITSSRHLKFKFPQGTSFTTLAVGAEETSFGELYQEHKELVERDGSGRRISSIRVPAQNKSVSKKFEVERRGGSRRVNPYGRRWDDKKDF